MNKLKEIFLEDIGLKLLALLLAILLWAYLMVQETHTRQIKVPLQLTNMPMDRLLVGDIINSVMVTVKGRTGVLMSLSKDDFDAEADLSNCRRSGEYIITPRVTSRESAAQILSVSPMQINIRLESVE